VCPTSSGFGCFHQFCHSTLSLSSILIFFQYILVVPSVCTVPLTKDKFLISEQVLLLYISILYILCSILHSVYSIPHNCVLLQQSGEDIRDSSSLRYEVEEVDEDVQAEGDILEYPDLLYSSYLVL